MRRYGTDKSLRQKEHLDSNSGSALFSSSSKGTYTPPAVITVRPGKTALSHLVRTEAIRLDIVLHGEAVIKQKPMIAFPTVAVVDLSAAGNILQGNLMEVRITFGSKYYWIINEINGMYMYVCMYRMCQFNRWRRRLYEIQYVCLRMYVRICFQCTIVKCVRRTTVKACKGSSNCHFVSRGR